jgi:DNA-binding MarR family transcriptional regulator
LNNGCKFAIISPVEVTTAQRDAGEQRITAADRDLGLQLGAVMLRCMSSDGGAVIRALDESGITFIQMKVLVTLAGEHSEPPTLKFLAESLELSLASASRAVDGLVKRRLVARVEDTDDRRVRRLSLTDAGRSLSHRILTARLEGLGRFVSSLASAERAKLEAALELLLERDEIAEVYRRYRKEARG